MGFIRCQREDPFARRVREVYRASIVRAPREGIKTLDVVAQKGTHVEPRGSLEPLLVPSPDSLVLPPHEENLAGDLSGERSAELDISVGVKLLGAFLTALAGGVPLPTVNLELTPWRGASKFTFEARGVRERTVDLSVLGQALTGRRVNREQPAAAIYFDGSGTQMRLISRTLVSPQVAVRAHTTREHAIEASTAGIADMLGKASVAIDVSVENDGAVTFTGSPENAAVFAMAHIPCILTQDGAMTLGLDVGGRSYLDEARGPREEDVIVNHFPLVNEVGLVEFDNPAPEGVR